MQLNVLYDHKLPFCWVICSSLTTCGDRSWYYHLLLGKRKALLNGSCNNKSKLSRSSKCACTKLQHISIQTSRCISGTRRQMCLPQSVAPPRAQPLCSLHMILPLCTTASSSHCHPPCPPCTFPPSLMRTNEWWSHACVRACARWFPCIVYDKPDLRDDGAKRTTVPDCNYRRSTEPLLRPSEKTRPLCEPPV